MSIVPDGRYVVGSGPNAGAVVYVNRSLPTYPVTVATRHGLEALDQIIEEGGLRPFPHSRRPRLALVRDSDGMAR